jgi:hypothetical protein
MTLLAVKPSLPQPDIGSLLEALAKHQPVELDCTASPTKIATIEVRSRRDLEEKLAELYPFRPHMSPLEDAGRVGVGIMLVEGPPIRGEGDNLAAAIADLLDNALGYITRWESELRFDIAHQRYWGWVYRLMICGDDDHIKATLLAQGQ